MRQQINLYQPIFAGERRPLSAATMAVVLGVAMLVAVAYTAHVKLAVETLDTDVANLRLQVEQLTPVSDVPDEEIQARLAGLEASLAARRGALAMLQAGAAGKTTGFAARLEALARRHVDGVWVERIVMAGADASLDLSGVALSADRVPEYLQTLSREPALSGARFDDFTIERDIIERGDTHTRFRVGSKTLMNAQPQEAP